MNALPAALPPFAAPYDPADEGLAAGFLADQPRDAVAERRVDARARRLIEAIRGKIGGLGGVEDFLHAFSLSTKEGLALMVLAEALLRVPDAATADRLIEDKLAAGRWFDGEIKSHAVVVSASAWTLGVAARVIHPGETPHGILDAIVRRLARRCGSSAGISCSARPSRRRSIAPAATPMSAIRSTCSARARAPRPMRKNILPLMRPRSKRSALMPAMRRYRGGLAFPSS